jgi:hypothetical protein
MAAVARTLMAQPVYIQLRKCPVRSGTYASCHEETSMAERALCDGLKQLRGRARSVLSGLSKFWQSFWISSWVPNRSVDDRADDESCVSLRGANGRARWSCVVSRLLAHLARQRAKTGFCAKAVA